MLGKIDAILFDVFGTLVDWRSSLIDELTAFARSRGLDLHVEALVDDWRRAYLPSMDQVRRGSLPWTDLDALHRLSLDALLERAGIDLPEEDRAHLARAWHRLRPWPDTVPGMTRLRARYPLGSLSNGNVALQVSLARFAGLPFDVLFSAEHFRHYKPDPETYLGACAYLALPPERVMLVASHNRDLDAARSHGLRTAFVARPTEYGPRQGWDLTPSPGVDVAVRDLGELADRLGA